MPPEAKPLDARLAALLVSPLRGSPVTPNHLTTVRLAIGLAAAALLAQGDALATNLGALCFALSLFLDHADGELARMTGAMSRFGHRYDLLCDLLINALLFVSLGIGLARSGGGAAALVQGLLAGSAVALAVVVNSALRQTPPQVRDEAAAGSGYFELEDILYLFPLLAVCGLLPVFLLLAAVGAPLFALWVSWLYFLRYRRRP